MKLVFGLLLVWSIVLNADNSFPTNSLELDLNSLANSNDENRKFILNRVAVKIVDAVENSPDPKSTLILLKKVDDTVLNMLIPNWIMYSDEYILALKNGDGEQNLGLKIKKNSSFGELRSPSFFSLHKRDLRSLVLAGINRLESMEKK